MTTNTTDINTDTIDNSEELDFLETPQYDNNNSGTLAANTMRQKPSHPNAKGRCLIGGLWYWISGWNKMNAATDSRFVSLAFTEMTTEDVAKYVTKGDSAPSMKPVEEPTNEPKPEPKDDGIH